MHEYSIVQALIDRVTQEAVAHNAIGIQRVMVKIGELSGVEVELLETAYLTCRDETICAGAPLQITFVPADWHCRQCDRPIPRGASLRCAACGGAAVLAGGDEILLERIDLEVA